MLAAIGIKYPKQIAYVYVARWALAFQHKEFYKLVLVVPVLAM